jgi:MoCo/4Fe-4S cofactor protein with predicted Tat translocation signal
MDNNLESPKPTPKYWMSLEQWRNDPEFLKMAENEFLSSPLQSSDGQDGWARREFLKLMGASLALTTFGCVRRPAQKIIPYAKKPFDVIHGIPDYYASSQVDGLEGIGILVTTRDGRPIKIEGNTEHPANAGGMSARAHATIMKLYDPDRATGPKRNLQNKDRSNFETIGAKWEDLDKVVVEQMKKGKVAVLMAANLSPSTHALMDEFTGAFGAKVYQYDDLCYSSLSEAQKASYGTEVIPRYRIDQAKYIVAINNDFLGTWLTPISFQRQFGAARKANAEMNKLVVIEPLLTLTGSNADVRYRIRPSQSLDAVMALLHEIVVVRKQSRYSADAVVLKTLNAFEGRTKDLGFNVAEVAAELWNHRGQSLVLSGGLAAGTSGQKALQIATNFLNSVLENDGKTIDGSGTIISQSRGPKAGIGELLTAVDKKEVSTLIIHGSNPAYSMPVQAKLREAFNNVEMVLYTGDRNDETGRLADYLIVDHHPMENWGDMQAYDGVLSIQQPTIRPLYDTRAFQDSLLIWTKALNKGSARLKAAGSWYDYLHAQWKDVIYPAHKGKSKALTFDDFWVDFLQSGVLNTGKAEGGSRSFASASLNEIKPETSANGFELALYPTVGLGDGSLANVPWLMEFPDPVSKITWENYATISPRDAKKMKLHEGQVLRLTVGVQQLEVPAHIQPGQADGVVGLAVGYGRKGAGKVADGCGVNAFALAGWENGQRITAGLETKVEMLSERIPLANVQGHSTMEGRQIVVEDVLNDYLKNPGGTIHRHKSTSMWSGFKYNGHKWGMTIDLNSCTGCGSCMIACQSENNIPTVGKINVLSGREMHWIRIDRYFTGTPEDPAVVNQPLPCMHCDNAPCETVCPVAATVHSDEGTNDMIYNRCVGTRYCSNNCPYKVRRFNWFSYTEIQKPRELALNPEVTQRFRGVMEKCTFCIHRVKYVKYRAKIEDRTLKDGDVKAACQQSCPTNAIVFGDLNDPNSQVAKLFHEPQSYALLEELNTQPAVRYHVKVRNTDKLKETPTTGHEGHSTEGGHHA